MNNSRKQELQNILDYFLEKEQNAGEDSFNTLQIKVFRDLVKRQEFIEKLISEGERPLSFTKGNFTFLIHNDLETSGYWRVTTFNSDETQIGHSTFSSFEECLDRVINDEMAKIDSIQRW